jgi:hypothetical protein
MTATMYRIRFYAETRLLSETERKTVERLPKQGMHTFNDPCLPKTTYLSEGGGWIWFETRLAFVPSLGLNYYPDVSDFDWGEEKPIVKEVIYREEDDLFIVELDWGIFNPFKILRHLHEKQS